MLYEFNKCFHKPIAVDNLILKISHFRTIYTRCIRCEPILESEKQMQIMQK